MGMQVKTSGVLGVRMPLERLNRLRARATAEGKTISAFGLELIDKALAAIKGVVMDKQELEQLAEFAEARARMHFERAEHWFKLGGISSTAEDLEKAGAFTSAAADLRGRAAEASE